MKTIKLVLDMIENLYLKTKIRLLFLWDKEGYDELMKSFKIRK